MFLRKSLISFFLSLNLIFILLLLLSCFAPYISPERLWMFALLGLSFPLLILVNIFWMLFWLFFKRSLSLLSLSALLLSSFSMINYFSISPCRMDESSESITVMSYNVKTFDLYNWNQNEASKNAMLDVIEEANPHILCLQEFYTDDTKSFNILERLNSTYPYIHFQKTLTLDKYMHWGIATFSKFPIISEDVIQFSNSRHNLSIASDIRIGEDTIRIYNAHLQSIHLGKDEYESVQNLRDNRGKFPFGKFYNKLKDAFIKRAFQTDILNEHIRGSSLKRIICADFNDSPNSHTYRILSKGFTDSFKSAGCGLGGTYAGPFPSFRIDFIFVDEKLNVKSHRVIDNAISDHYPIVCSFTFD